eukprot:GCRY01003073.1.p1 GENE.GCRY01003073.1~~GCRY01003073.1.p1  ORF type:complete len:932 (+),score=230.69 GCRY01003073.1:322-3117(+)
MLRFHQEAFEQLVKEDALCVFGKGLMLDMVVQNLAVHYASMKKTVVFLNFLQSQEEAICDYMLFKSCKNVPPLSVKVSTGAERVKLYAAGGVMFISARVLVLDILMNRLKPELISGLVFGFAQGIRRNQNEALIITLLKESNPSLFVKAVSEDPVRVASYPPQHLLSLLSLRKLHIWPRFHESVAAALDVAQPEVVELHVALTPMMRQIHDSILALMEICLAELEKVPAFQEINLQLEKALSRHFLKQTKKVLDAVWHTITPHHRQLLSDIGLLRSLAFGLFELDAVRFFHMVEGIRSEFALQRHHSGWQFLPQANAIFTLTRDRVFGPSDPSQQPSASPQANPRTKDFEINPKLPLVENVLEEIAATEGLAGPTAIVVGSQYGADVLCSFLSGEMPPLTASLATPGQSDPDSANSREKSEDSGSEIEIVGDECPTVPTLLGDGSAAKDLDSANSPKGPADSPNGAADSKDEKILQLREELRQQGAEELDGGVWVRQDGTVVFEADVGESSTPVDGESEAPPEVIHPSPTAKKKGKRKRRSGARAKNKGQKAENPLSDSENETAAADVLRLIGGAGADPAESGSLGLSCACPENPVVVIPQHSLRDVLPQLRPKSVILVDPLPTAVRLIECLHAMHPPVFSRVYFLIFDESGQRSLYVDSLSQEQTAAEKLIRFRTTYVPALAPPAFVEVPKERRRLVLVDTREFGSSLPTMLYMKGFALEVLQLDVGDYILSPKIVIERKSVSDLIGSLASGRLFSQCTNMATHYSTPVLLIEFTPDRSFSLTPKSALRDDFSLHELQAKLSLLALHFPTLRIIWSLSPQETAAIFAGLTQHTPPPDATTSRVLLGEEIESGGNHLHNAARELVRRIPGVNEKMIRPLCDLRGGLKDILDLATSPQSRLTSLVGAKAAKEMRSFFSARLQISAPSGKTVK